MIHDDVQTMFASALGSLRLRSDLEAFLVQIAPDAFDMIQTGGVGAEVRDTLAKPARPLVEFTCKDTL